MRVKTDQQQKMSSAAPFVKSPSEGWGIYDFGVAKHGQRHGMSENPLANPDKKDLIVFFTLLDRRHIKSTIADTGFCNFALSWTFTICQIASGRA